MKKLSVSVLGKSFNLSMEEDFAQKYEVEIENVLRSCSKPEKLIEAYLSKMYDYYALEKKLEQILQKTQNAY